MLILIKRMFNLEYVFNFGTVKSKPRNCLLSIFNERKGWSSFPFLILKLPGKKPIHLSLVNKPSFPSIHRAKLLAFGFGN